MNPFRLLFPPRASSVAGQVDDLFGYLLVCSAAIVLLVLFLIVYFALRYRRKSDKPPPATRNSNALEIFWSVASLVLFLTMFFWGSAVYTRMFRPPPDVMQINVVAKQWMWKIQHPEGIREIDALHVPLGRPVQLIMISQDVIHDFYVPAFRIHQDVLPGRYTSEWFTPTEVGEYHLFCSQYCGTDHSKMIGTVFVMEPSKYEDWLSGTAADVPLKIAGQKLFAVYGCAACHGQRGPSLAGLYGRPVQLEGGGSVLADDNYLRQSVLYPGARVVRGYPPIMPSYRGQMTEDQLVQLIAYIKSLSGAADTGPMGSGAAESGSPATQPLRAVPGPGDFSPGQEHQP